MVRKVVFMVLLVFICLFGCRNNQADKNKIKQQENIVKDLNYHLGTGLKELGNDFGIEQKLTEDVYLRRFAFYEKKLNHYALILELQDDIREVVVSKYTFAVEGFVVGSEMENLSDYAKSKKRTHESWYGTPKLTKVNGRCYVILDVKTKLRNFDLIKFYLFDRDGYKGDIGERILFYDYKI